MMGIMSDDFNLLLKKNDAMLIEVINDLSKIQKNCLALTSNFKSNDLNFISSKLDIETNQLNNIVKKINSYQTTLKSIYSGYQKQQEQIVKDSKKLIS